MMECNIGGRDGFICEIADNYEIRFPSIGQVAGRAHLKGDTGKGFTPQDSLRLGYEMQIMKYDTFFCSFTLAALTTESVPLHSTLWLVPSIYDVRIVAPQQYPKGIVFVEVCPSTLN
jgi:hypothetical protein